MDEPVGDQAMLPLFALAREASRVVKVVLSGEGADELFGGYSYYAPFARSPSQGVIDHILTLPLHGEGGRAYFIGEHEQTASGFPTVLPREVRKRLSKSPIRADGTWHEELLADLGSVHDPLRRATLCDILTWLSEDLLMKADKMTMANSLEGRAPYLAPRLAESAFSLPEAEKIANGTVKVALRQAAKPHLPNTIFTRRKQGWVLPMHRWLTEDLHDEFVDAIRSCESPLIDKMYLETLVQKRRDSDATALGERALYALLVMVRWLNHASRRVAETRAAMIQRARASA